MGLVIISAVNTTRTDYADRRAIGLHATNLHGAGVGTQHMRRAIIAFGTMGVKSVHLGARRVVARNIERIKVVPIALDLGAFCNGKAHVGENCSDFFPNLTDRVQRPRRPSARRQCHVKPLGTQTLIKNRVFKRFFFGSQRRIDFVFKCVQHRTSFLPLLRCHFTQFTHLKADFAFFANGLHTQIFENRSILRLRNQAKVFGT